MYFKYFGKNVFKVPSIYKYFSKYNIIYKYNIGIYIQDNFSKY